MSCQLYYCPNEGYIPLTDIAVDCVVDYSTSTGSIYENNAVGFPDVAAYLGHGSRVTIPCFRVPGALYSPRSRVNPGARLSVIVYYGLCHLNIRFLRRNQTFRFRSLTAKDGTQHWEFMP